MVFSPTRQPVQTVSELTRSLRGILETTFSFVSVMGEISNLRCPHSGHLYFTLKDAGAQLKGVLFKPQQRYLACTPADGMEVICRGRIALYEPRGEYQLVVDTMEPRGAGALRLALELLRQRLAAEGLFDPARKRPLPLLPERICLITSPQGAAVHDFLRMARQRCPSVPIDIIPVRVQGEGAAAEIAAAIRLCNELGRSDVVVVCRGGGSIEDLWCFNEEITVRAMAASGIPVVSAVGHEIDVTLADLVADLRVPTPTAAAEAVLPGREQMSLRLRTLHQRLATAITTAIGAHRRTVCDHRRVLGDPTSLLDHFRLATDHVVSGLYYAFSTATHGRRLRLAALQQALAGHNPLQHLSLRTQRMDALQHRLAVAMQHRLEQHHAQLRNNAGLLQAVSPLAVLARGYSIVQRGDGSVVFDSRQVCVGERVEVTLRHGLLHCEVTQAMAEQRPEPAAEGVIGKKRPVSEGWPG